MTTRGQVRHAFPAYRIFIFGIDVTEDVLDVDVNWDVGRAPNTCTFTLANPDDKYIFTSQDLLTLFKDTQDIVDSFIEEASNLQQSNLNEGNINIDDTIDFQNINDQIIQSAIENIQLLRPDIKRRVVEKKFTVKSENISATELDGSESAQGILIGNAARYPFSAEDPIWHPNDPIRVFYRDPFNPARWYHMFAGFASDFQDEVDENNQKLLVISGEGPTKLLRYARITTNPGVIDINAVADSERDAVLRTVWQSGFSNITLPELMFAIIFGNNPDDDTKFSIRRDTEKETAISKSRFGGVGHFNLEKSGVLEFGPPSTGGNEDALQSVQSVSITSIDSLQAWQSLIDHEVKITDLADMAIPEFNGESLFSEVIRFADGTPDPRSVITILGERPDIFPTDGGRLLLLIPASFHPQTNREILLKDMIRNFRLQTEFSSRLGIIYDTIDNIEFLFYESPKGDLICEFPLYDFDPKDWNVEDKISHQQFENGDLSENDDVDRGPFGSRYIISKKNTYNFSRQYSDEKVRTQMVSYWSLIQQLDETGDTRDIIKPVVINLKHLWPLYGIRTEQVPPRSFIASQEAAYATAHVYLNKMNADAINLGINAVPNFGLWLNRPIQFLPRNLIGTTSSLSHGIKWGMGGSVDTRVNLRYVRTWDGLTDNNNEPLYTPIGGQVSRPLDYKVLFKLKQAKSGNNQNTPSSD